MNIGEQIASYRKKHGYSQEELSQVSGISLRTIQRIEKGTVHPRGYTIRALSESLKIELSELKSNIVPTKNEVAKKAHTLNLLGLLVILFPIVSIFLQVIYWIKNKHFLSNHLPSRKVLSFQILWIFVVIISILLIHPLTNLITGQSIYGTFPIRMTVYVILLLTNIFVIWHTALKLSKDSPILIQNVPSVI